MAKQNFEKIKKGGKGKPPNFGPKGGDKMKPPIKEGGKKGGKC